MSTANVVSNFERTQAQVSKERKAQKGNDFYTFNNALTVVAVEEARLWCQTHKTIITMWTKNPSPQTPKESEPERAKGYKIIPPVTQHIK